MPISSPTQISENRPVPVPHGVAVPLKKDERWKYALIVAIILLLLLLLLLLAFAGKPTGTSTQGDGAASQGTNQAGMNPDGDSADDDSAGAESQEESAVAESTGNHTSVAGTTGPADNSDNGTDNETALPVVTDADISKSTLDELLRRISAEPDETTETQSEDKRNQTGGNDLVKGDASVNFFGATGKGSKFVFVFDRSASMNGRPLESVKRELIKALEPLKNHHSFNIIAYDNRYEIWKSKLIAATKENKVDAVRFVDNIVSRGGTEPREPLLAAIEQKPEIIFFMTDGEFSLNVDEICAHGKGISINVVQFSDNLPLAVLHELAKRTGGDFMLVKVRGLNDAL